MRKLLKEKEKSRADLLHGFSLRNIRDFRRFYLCFPNLFASQQFISNNKINKIRQTVSTEFETSMSQTGFTKLTWSHFQAVLKVSDEKARVYYFTEADEQNWTVRTIAKYSVLNENKQLFTSKYMPYLPTEEELVAEIEKRKLIFRQQHSK